MLGKAWVLPFLVITACKSSDDFPVKGGGTGSDPIGGADSGIAHHDAVVDSPPDATVLSGTVCLVSDLRNLTTCEAPGKVNVSLTGTTTTTTTTDPTGTFIIAEPAGANLVWHVSGTGIVTSTMAESLGTKIPVMAADVYSALLSDNGVTVDPVTQGSLVIGYLRGTPLKPLAGVVVTPADQVSVFYEGTTATIWNGTATGASGLAWLPSVPVGPTTLTSKPPMTGASMMETETIEAATITFAQESNI